MHGVYVFESRGWENRIGQCGGYLLTINRYLLLPLFIIYISERVARDLELVDSVILTKETSKGFFYIFVLKIHIYILVRYM